MNHEARVGSHHIHRHGTVSFELASLSQHQLELQAAVKASRCCTGSVRPLNQEHWIVAVREQLHDQLRSTGGWCCWWCSCLEFWIGLGQTLAVACLCFPVCCFVDTMDRIATADPSCWSCLRTSLQAETRISLMTACPPMGPPSSSSRGRNSSVSSSRSTVSGRVRHCCLAWHCAY